MSQAREPRTNGSDRSIAVFVLSIALLLTPAVDWWAGDHAPWWSGFAIWGLLIAACRYVNRARD